MLDKVNLTIINKTKLIIKYLYDDKYYQLRKVFDKLSSITSCSLIYIVNLISRGHKDICRGVYHVFFIN